MSTLTCHLVTRNPDAAAAWYASVLDAVEDADAVWQRAMTEGATEFEPLHDAFWGERTGQFIDPFGHRWAVDQHLADVPHEEVVRLAAAAFGGGQP
jgi:PhnB protein